MKKLILIAAVMALFVYLSFEAAAVPGVIDTGTFSAVLNSGGGIENGAGDGYEWPDGSKWLYYSDAPGEPWWNQWWYNDPWQPTGKEVRLQFDYQASSTSSWFIEVTLNWSNEQWVGMDRPPDPTEEWAIERLEWHPPFPILTIGLIGNSTVYHRYTDWVRLPIDYNPEWVSVDIRGENVEITNGIIEHVCLVPEPSSLALIGIGLLALMRRK